MNPGSGRPSIPWRLAFRKRIDRPTSQAVLVQARGERGNPGGRPRGAKDFAEFIASETRDGAELVEYALYVLRSDKSKPLEKQWAVEFLAERMLGRTPQAIELAGEEREAKALAFFQPPTEEQVKLMERMVKALPEGETALTRSGAARNGGQ